MNSRKFAYSLPQGLSLEPFVAELESLYTVKKDAFVGVREQYMDTFDWRLYKEGFLLRRNNGRYLLSTLNGTVLLEEAGTKKKNPFWWDFSSGFLQSQLEKVIGIRALMPLVMVHKKSQSLKLLNKDRKTVVSLLLESAVAEGEDGTKSTLSPILHGQEVRGYRKAFDNACCFLSKSDCSEISLEESLLPRALKVTDRSVFDYSSKFSVSLSADYHVHEAISTICLNLLNAMRCNLPGVLADIDSEFLHDFRIAVRRTRSLITQLKKVLPEEVVAYFGQEFKQLGAITGPVRDLDVYLLKKPEFSTMLPAQLLSGLEIFFESLQQKRRQEVRKMRRQLMSESVMNLFDQWQEFHSSAPGDSWRGSEKICQKVAVKVISKRFDRILRDGAAITPETPDQALHELRIHGKKLRYLIEFFRSFFEEEKVEFFLKQMKKLQNNLGDFNDLSVQQDMLSDYHDGLSGRTKRTLKVASALGGLIAHLNDEQIKVRKKFEKTFDRFSDDETVDLFHQTFISKLK